MNEEHEHEFPRERPHNETFTVKVNGDVLVRSVQCTKCSKPLEMWYSGKHAQYIDPIIGNNVKDDCPIK